MDLAFKDYITLALIATVQTALLGMLIGWCVRRFVRPMTVVSSYLTGVGAVLVFSLIYLAYEGMTSPDMLLIALVGAILGFCILYATRGIAGVKR